MINNIMYHQLQTLDSPSVITFSTERPQMLVPRSFIAQNAPTESCRCTIRIPWYHQNPAYTHRILFALTACLCYFKLCASFHNHQWNQTGVTVWKCPIRVKIDDFMSLVTLRFDRWPWKKVGQNFYVTSSFVYHFVAIGEFKLELQSRNAQLG